MIKIICLGDVVGPKGCCVVARQIQALKARYTPDVIIVNGENSGINGKGPTPESLQAILNAGAHVITGGNHSFGRREIYDFYAKNKNVLRPCNYPIEAPGIGYTTITVGPEQDITVGVINVQLRVFMREHLACPFKSVEAILATMRHKTSYIVIDVHGEATAEKVSFAYHFDGKVSAIFGTHTHIQTADERILPKGTAYITDAGMTGALNSSLGVKYSGTIANFITQLPVKFETEDQGPFVTGGIYVEVEKKTALAKVIKRLTITYATD